jgi:hypothetical protein
MMMMMMMMMKGNLLCDVTEIEQTFKNKYHNEKH